MKAGADKKARAGTTAEDGRKDPKERILDAAIELFAEKGFDGTGVREIAASADVNLAMINYYYGSKLKVLQAIMEKVLKGLSDGLVACIRPEMGIEERVEQYFRSAVGLMRNNPKLVRVALAHIHLDHRFRELSEFKAEKLREFALPTILQIMQPAADGASRPIPPWLAGTIHGMLMFHFLERMTRSLEGTPRSSERMIRSVG